ncbi:MAG: Argininosuccinate lyase 1 [Elusimicrobia bacterium ADurb.Bin231]|nr:MAG: Argininosuccinate lyase 1 [Elusimicrobia bacterium ADurb.Bin231]
MNLKNFVSSIDYDIVLAEYDMQGSIAHTDMLAKCRIITRAEASKITSALKKMIDEFKKGKLKLKGEDIHTAVELELTKRIGTTAGKMHTARSRNDQVVLAERMYIKDQIKNINDNIDESISAIKKLAKKHPSCVMPGFTHLQNAQPVLFSHWILSYAWMLKRDKERFSDLYKRTDVMPLGAAAFAGTEFPIDRKYTAKLLGFRKISDNSVDTVSDRDYIAEFLADCAILAMHISRFAEELVIWSSQQFGFIKFSSDFTTGSSIMPQKRNPDFAEILRAKTGRIYGNLMAILTIMKGIPLSYNRDMQEDKEPMFDSVETVKISLAAFSEMFSAMKVNEDKMSEACGKGHILSTDVADYLVKKGIPFRHAHGIVSKLSDYLISSGKRFEDLTKKEWKRFSDKFDASVKKIFDYKSAAEKKDCDGGTSTRSVKKQLSVL